MYRMTEKEFEHAIDEALQSIPEEFLRALENVAVVAQDEPNAYQLGRAAGEDEEWTEEELEAWFDEANGDADAPDEESGFDALSDEEEFDDLLGLYDGIPLTKRDDYAWDIPDVITVFKGPHERLCNSREEMVEEIRKTVVHEIGHYFGMDEEAIDEMGYA